MPYRLCGIRFFSTSPRSNAFAAVLCPPTVSLRPRTARSSIRNRSETIIIHHTRSADRSRVRRTTYFFVLAQVFQHETEFVLEYVPELFVPLLNAPDGVEFQVRGEFFRRWQTPSRVRVDRELDENREIGDHQFPKAFEFPKTDAIAYFKHRVRASVQIPNEI